VDPVGRRRVAAAALVTGALSIAVSSVLVRRAFDFGSDPETLVAIRVAVPAAVFATWALAAGLLGRPRRRLSRTALACCVVYGLLLLVVNLFELRALERIPVALVILIIALVPLWISLASRLLWGTRLGRRGGAALVVALGGTALVVGSPAGGLDAVGIAFSLGASMLSAGVYLLLERTLRDVAPRTVIALGGSVATAAAVAFEPRALEVELATDAARTGLVLGAGLAVSLTMLLSIVGIRHSSAFVAGVAVTCEPVFAGLLAWWILGETLSTLQLLGGAVALCGLALALSGVQVQRGEPAVLPEAGR
jgi:drug/metabolite transporter (DMT)-like permease